MNVKCDFNHDTKETASTDRPVREKDGQETDWRTDSLDLVDGQRPFDIMQIVLFAVRVHQLAIALQALEFLLGHVVALLLVGVQVGGPEACFVCRR